jgi:hypothetical protein
MTEQYAALRISISKIDPALIGDKRLRDLFNAEPNAIDASPSFRGQLKFQTAENQIEIS